MCSEMLFIDCDKKLKIEPKNRHIKEFKTKIIKKIKKNKIKGY